MQTDYAPERLHTDVPSKEALLAAAQDGSILQATAARCDVQHNLIIPLDGMTGIMPREECALGIDTGKTREIAILSRVGKPVSFQVLRIRGDVAYVSRKRAQQRAFEYLLHKRPGDILPVRVTHLEPFGAFVDAGCGLVSLIGIENLSVSRIFHPSDRVQVGQQLYAVLSDIDADTGRISRRTASCSAHGRKTPHSSPPVRPSAASCAAWRTTACSSSWRPIYPVWRSCAFRLPPEIWCPATSSPSCRSA